MTQHHWQCVATHGDHHECNCGISGPRAWWMDMLPHDRAPTEAEAAAWHAALAHEDELGAAHEPLEDPETPTDLTLDDLPDRWTPVARRVQATPHTDGWEWHLSPADVSALQIGVVHGSVLLANARDADGKPILKAKRTRKPDPVERFAVMGRGMFEL